MFLQFGKFVSQFLIFFSELTMSQMSYKRRKEKHIHAARVHALNFTKEIPILDVSLQFCQRTLIAKKSHNSRYLFVLRNW